MTDKQKKTADPIDKQRRLVLTLTGRAKNMRLKADRLDVQIAAEDAKYKAMCQPVVVGVETGGPHASGT